MDIAKKLGAYSLWIILALLSAWAFVLGRSVMLTVLANYAGTSFTRNNQARFLNLFFSIVLGLAWFVFVITSEGRIRKGIKKDRVLEYFLRLAGPLLLFLFSLDMVIFIYQRFALVDWVRLLILITELGLGVICVYFGWSTRSPLLKKA